jgi:predicted enzyme related to lactoylglutathione lyase
MIKVTAIPFTGYPVTDMSRARGFYEGVLGLKTGAIWEHEGRAWVEYDVGPATIAISNMAGDQWKPSSDGPSVALEVENFDEAVATLRQQGVKFALEPTEAPTCRLAVVCDPDGNSVAIHQKHLH